MNNINNNDDDDVIAQKFLIYDIISEYGYLPLNDIINKNCVNMYWRL